MPTYLPQPARALLPWARRYAATAARRWSVSLDDTWDETLTALLRATAYFQPGAGSFVTYARTAVIRGLWRYCHRPIRRPNDPSAVTLARALTAPSPETLAIVAEAAADSVTHELDRITARTLRGTSRPRAAGCP